MTVPNPAHTMPNTPGHKRQRLRLMPPHRAHRPCLMARRARWAWSASKNKGNTPRRSAHARPPCPTGWRTLAGRASSTGPVTSGAATATHPRQEHT
jgi:hypothetical protein